MTDKKKIRTVIQYLGFIRNPMDERVKTKTYVFAGVQEGRDVIYLEQLMLADFEGHGWETVKEYKGMFLQKDTIIIRFETFMSVADMVIRNRGIYDLIHKHENNTDDKR